MSAALLDRDERVNAAIALVQAAGYRVVLQEPWITSGQLGAEYGFTPQEMSLRLKHAHCPSYEADRSATGRLLRLRPNPALREFLAARPVKPHRPTPDFDTHTS